MTGSEFPKVEPILCSGGGGTLLIDTGEKVYTIDSDEALVLMSRMLDALRRIMSPRIIVGDIFFESEGDEYP